MGPDRAHTGPSVRLAILSPWLPELLRNFGIETAWFKGYYPEGNFRWGAHKLSG